MKAVDRNVKRKHHLLTNTQRALEELRFVEKSIETHGSGVAACALNNMLFDTRRSGAERTEKFIELETWSLSRPKSQLNDIALPDSETHRYR